jgi:EmrB/QacA subfamily drug resistance transporter
VSRRGEAGDHPAASSSAAPAAPSAQPAAAPSTSAAAPSAQPAAAPSASAAAARPSSRRWISLGALCLSAAIVWFAAANIPVATSAISADLGGSVTALQWVNTIFTLVCGALVIAAGRLGDIFGRRRVLGIGLIVFAAASVVAALAPTTGALVAGRALMGVGAAAILPATLAIIPLEFSAREQVTAFSAWMATTAVGQAAAPAISGGLTEFLGWPAIFWINVPLCVAAYLLVTWSTPESCDQGASRSLDYPGLVTVAAGLVALLYVLNEGPNSGWGSPGILAAIAAAVVLLAAFVLIERRTREPLIDLGLFRRRSFDGALIDNLIYNITLSGTMYVLALYLEQVRGYDAFTAGLLLLPSTVSILAFIMVGARLELRRGPRIPLTAGFFIMGVGTFLVGFLEPDTAYWWFATGLFIQGIGIGLYSTPLSDVAVGLAPPDESGAASGAFKMCSMVGGAFGVAVFGGVYRAIQMSSLKASAAAADLTSAQQQQVNDAFSSSEKAKQIYETLAPDVQKRVVAAVNDALSSGIGGSLKLAALLAVLAVVATLLLVPKGILHADRQVDGPG